MRGCFFETLNLLISERELFIPTVMKEGRSVIWFLVNDLKQDREKRGILVSKCCIELRD